MQFTSYVVFHFLFFVNKSEIDPDYYDYCDTRFWKVFKINGL